MSIVPSWTGFVRQALDPVWPGPFVRYHFVTQNGTQLGRLADDLQRGTVVSVVTKTLEFSDVGAAFRRRRPGWDKEKPVASSGLADLTGAMAVCFTFAAPVLYIDCGERFVDRTHENPC